jgi:hypothetical protein
VGQAARLHRSQAQPPRGRLIKRRKSDHKDGLAPPLRRLAGACKACRRDPRPPPARPVRGGQRPWRAPRGRGRGRLSRLLQEPGHRPDAPAARPACGGTRLAPADRCDVRRQRDQLDRGPRGSARRTACARGVAHRGRRRRRRRGGARRAGPDVGVRGARARGPLAGLDRQAGPQRGQHRYRRLRSRPGDGLRSASPLHPAGHDLPLRLQRGRHRLRRGDTRPRPGRDAVHRLVEDVHDPGDDDERAQREAVAARRT